MASVGARRQLQYEEPLSDRHRFGFKRALDLIRVDFSFDHPRPRPIRTTVAFVVALVGSVVADMILVAIGTAAYPATRGYAHFRFAAYGKLTVVGVVIACVAWPIVTSISSAPRWLFFRLAILVTLFLWLPDLWIWLKGQPTDAVLVLVVMHVAIALVTYNALVRIARVEGAS